MGFPGWRPSKIRALGSFSVALIAFFCVTLRIRAGDDPLDSVMYKDPELPRAKITRAPPPDLASVWLVALRRPEADYQTRAALTIVMAHQEGVKGLEVTVDPLVEILSGPDHHALARLAAARALIELDARRAAEQMLNQVKTGDHDLRELIGPALASWKYQPAREHWLERLRQPDVPSGELMLAMRGLAALREPEAASRLTELVDSSEVSWPVRLEAARALGVIRTSGSESEAERLLASGASYEAGDQTPAGTSAHLAAAWLLHHHQGDEAVRLLQGLARDVEPAVAFIALQRLLEIDAKLVLPVLDPVQASSDAKVRSLGVETLFREATIERLRLLADRMDDAHPEVRVKARHALLDLASKSQLKDEVIRQGMRILSGQGWRGLEQATILFARLDHKPAAGRIAELLQFERPEVFVSAAWGLRNLAVKETLPAALHRFQAAHQLINAPGSKIPPEAWDEQLSHLAQFMGQSRYQPADATLRREVPRRRRPFGEVEAAIGQETRAASIWALGFIHEGKSDQPLVKDLEGRLNDGPKPFDPGDDLRVRCMSAISLARMSSKDSLPSLRRYQATAKPTLNPLAHACSWAIQQLTGEAPPEPGSIQLPAKTFKNWLRSVPQEQKPGG